MNEISGALVPILVLLPVVDWVATIILIRLASKRPRIRFLTERAITAVVVSLAMTAFAVIFINTSLGGSLFSNDAARLIGRVTTLILGSAPLLWLYWYWRAAHTKGRG